MQIERYLGRISGPLLDRLDIHIEVPPVPFRELSNTQTGTTSAAMREQVIAARNIQRKRFGAQGLKLNGKMTPSQIRKHCVLDTEAENLLKGAMESMGLSARAHDKILRLSRTIADLDQSDRIATHHLSEAINYRTLDKQYWKG
jgi:magnesium chelatase family protein